MKIQVIQEMLSNRPKVEITYFIPDTKKDGGKYETIVNNVKKIDNYNGQIIMQNDLIIDIKDIVDINSDIFKSIVFD